MFASSGVRMKGLSPRQQAIVDFIRRFFADNGYPPTVRDIQAGCGISSTSVVDYNLNLLEKSGHVRRRRDERELHGAARLRLTCPR